MQPAEDHSFEEISEGMELTRDYTITPEVYEGYLRAFGDYSPIHASEEYAHERGYAGRVMQGGILNGFISHFVGMQFPGKRSLLLSVDLRYSNLSHLNDVLTLQARVSQKVESKRVIVITVAFYNQTRRWPAASGRVQVMVNER